MANRDVEFEIDLVYDTRNRVSEFVVPAVFEKGVRVCSHGLAVPPENLRLGYGNGEEGYLAGGRAEAQSVFDLLRMHGAALHADGRIMDFGCAAGRVTRWVKDFAPTAEVWGIDIDAPRIAWAKRALASRAHFTMTTKIPHLPFEDRSFELVFAFSVFSHIDDLADAWLLELQRILDAGKYAIVTIMDSTTISAMETKYSDYLLPQRLTGYVDFYRDRDFSMFSITRDSVPDVWYDTDYFVRCASRFYDVVAIVPEFHGWQTGVMLRKPV